MTAGEGRARSGARGDRKGPLAAVAGALLAALAFSASAAETPLRIGVLAYRPKPMVLEQWQPLAAYLEGRLEQPVELVALDYAEMDAAAAQRAVEVLITTSIHAIRLQHTAGLSPALATLVSREGEHQLRAYGGVIVARADRADVTSLADLAGKRIAAVAEDAFAGFQMPVLELVEAGLPRPSGDRLLLTGQPHDRVIEAVLAGRADAGFVRAGVLESLAAAGALDPGRLKVVNRQHLPAYPYAVSTRLYPEWPVAVMPQVDRRLAARLAGALLLLPPDSLGGAAASIHGFDIPGDYGAVETLMRRLHLPPFDQPLEITLADLWRRYGPWIAALAGLLLCLAAAIAGLVPLYRRSRLALRERERSLEERRKAEEALRGTEEEVRRLNQQLEQRVAERTAQLEAANQELEAFAYSVSHDLRAPLRHVLGFVELLQKRLAGGADEQVHHYTAAITDASRRMGQLIDDLLSFSRTGRAEMQRMSVDLGTLVREAIHELEPEARDRTVTWRQAELPVVNCDRAMMRVVLVNLVSNALKFTRPRAEAEIEIGCRPRDGETEVFVRDNGVGFDMKYAGKLYGVFQRLHAASDFDGVGIGLATVRRIVARHGGRTWAEGRVDGGATFSFSLPAEPPAAPAAPPSRTARPAPAGGGPDPG